jgi:uncharacterized protein (TIGR02594 family)
VSDEIQDTPNGAIRALLGAIGFILILLGGEMIKDSFHPLIGLFLLLLGVACYFALVVWKLVKKRLPERIPADLSIIATSPRWWFAILGIFGLAVILSPYVEQRRWPFTHTQFDDNAVSNTVSLPTKIPGLDAPWLTVVLKEYGQARLVGTQSNPRILEYLHSIPDTEHFTDKDDWASAFAEWSLNQVGIRGPKDMKPKAWLTWGQQIKTPQPGAIAVFNFDGTEHVGFILAETDRDLIVIGGNQETRVEVRRYPKSKVLDYRMPPPPK